MTGTIAHYTYTAGESTGVNTHEDGTVETLYGNNGCGPNTTSVALPEEHGGGRADVLHHMKQDCPVEECDGNHSMLLLAHANADGKGQLAVVECPTHGFLWCTL